ncbi:type II secretion system protein [Leptolyngbya cf. ectocarpi LEGE 11479]|uniref:Type II secretion system protein n=1 Tax=Leptolyngbya cf. ectocarpi LEGE 11479 TaxID=1828722 RepID=A0A928ZW55_LEPEC|nr:type II secretion system protein [Leptolyngbya ectocarpi]MBE9068597.1 type II secretion system protein [Leptolyngbya cf. ectocarpi LEGE 11479]
MKYSRAKLATGLSQRFNHNRNQQQGFTLLEVLIVILMTGVLASIAAPGWLGYLDRRRITTTQDNVFSAIRGAQLKAQERREEYQFSIRETDDGFLEWAAHPAAAAPVIWEESLSNTVEINTETDLENDNTADPLEPYYIRFDHRGNVSLPAGSALPQQLVLSSANNQDTGAGDNTAKSVVVQTIIGTLKKQ